MYYVIIKHIIFHFRKTIFMYYLCRSNHSIDKSTANRLTYYKSIVVGFSIKSLKAANHCAPTAPSTVRWSQLAVTDIYWAVVNLQKFTY